MPTSQKSSLDQPVLKLGVIAGGGDVPERLLHSCDKGGIEPFIIAFEGQTKPDILQGRKYMLTRMGAAGSIIRTLKSHDIHDLVFIGGIRRPTLKEMRPDFRTLQFFARLSAKALGDDGLLKAMKKELEREGFRIHGIQRFVHDLLAREGALGKCKPRKSDMQGIKRGLDVLMAIGSLDIGQGIVVQEDLVLGVEAAEGTSELIRRCGALKREGSGPVLIKISKPGQDQDLDLPTIGPDTVTEAGECGYAGIVVEAGRTLVIDPDRIAELADRFHMFVIGLNPEDFRT